MSEAKRYTAEESDSGAWRVMDEDLRDGGETEVCVCTGDVDPYMDEMRRDPRPDAARIARLLNAEEAVRAALRMIIACEDGGSLDDAYYDEYDAAIAKVRAALSALGEE